MVIVITATLACLLAAGATRAAVPWLQQQGLMAHENSRTMHTGSIPKGGGLPLLSAAVVALLLTIPWRDVNVIVVATAASLAVLSWRDDMGHISARIRLAVHFAVAALYVASLSTDALVLQGLAPIWLDRAFTIVALAWMMNLYNFMDGINGIAGTETVSIAAGYLLIGLVSGVVLSDAALAAALLGSSLGFLIWNYREKPLVFLGDVGSVPLGFLMGVLMIDLAVHGLWAAALILPAYFLADATLTLLMRVWRGEKPWEAHRSHFYQRAAQGLTRHLPVVARIAADNAALIACAVLTWRAPWLGVAGGVVIVSGLLSWLNRAGQR